MKYSDPVKVEEYLDTIAGVGVTDASIHALCAYPKYDTVQNISALWWKQRYQKIKLRVFGSFHETDLYRNIPYEKQAEELIRMGCDGIKFLHMKPDLRKLLGKGIKHPDYDRALSYMEEREIPVLIHSGDPETSFLLFVQLPGRSRVDSESVSQCKIRSYSRMGNV